MKTSLQLCSTVTVGLVLALVSLPASTHAASKPAENNKTSRESADLQTVPQIAIPQSVFAGPSQSGAARNPFFPQSVVVTAAKPIITNPDPSISLRLDGITSPPKPTAMINGKTFELREEGEVKSREGGKIWIKCIEIKPGSAVIEIKGERHELRLRPGVN